MYVRLVGKWLFEALEEDEPRRLTIAEVTRISRGCGYYLSDNFIAWLREKYPNATFSVDEDYKINSRIKSNKK